MTGASHPPRPIAALIVAALACFGCSRPPNDPEIRTVLNWLVCEECTAGEREALIAIGPRVVPFLASVLDSVPSIIVEPVRTRATNSWTTEIHPDRAAYVASRVDAVESLARIRAAQSLGDLRARAALEAGLILARNRGYRDDVIRAIRGAIDASRPGSTNRVDTVRVEPQTVSLAIGASGRLAVLLEDSLGNLLDGAVTWSSSNAQVATIDTEGLVQAVTLGTATITASAGSRSGTATVNVTPVPAAPPIVLIAGGDHQYAGPGSPLPDVVVVSAATPSGLPVAGLPVTWTVLLGGGSVSQAGATTNPGGLATAVWTIGTEGPQRLEVHVGTAPAVVFRATVN